MGRSVSSNRGQYWIVGVGNFYFKSFDYGTTFVDTKLYSSNSRLGTNSYSISPDGKAAGILVNMTVFTSNNYLQSFEPTDIDFSKLVDSHSVANLYTITDKLMLIDGQGSYYNMRVSTNCSAGEVYSLQIQKCTRCPLGEQLPTTSDAIFCSANNNNDKNSSDNNNNNNDYIVLAVLAIIIMIIIVAVTVHYYTRNIIIIAGLDASGELLPGVVQVVKTHNHPDDRQVIIFNTHKNASLAIAILKLRKETDLR